MRFRQLHKQHGPCFAQAFLDYAFHLGENSALAEYTRSPRPKRLERPKITAVVEVEIPLSARWRALPPQHCSARHYAGSRRDAGPDCCRPLRLVFWQVPL